MFLNFPEQVDAMNRIERRDEVDAAKLIIEAANERGGYRQLHTIEERAEVIRAQLAIGVDLRRIEENIDWALRDE